MEVRQKSKKILSSICSKKEAVTIDKLIHKISKDPNQYKNILYEIYSDLQNNDYDYIIENLKKRKVEWSNPFFDEVKNKLREHDEFIVSPFEVEEGVTECMSCGCKRCYTYTKQCRGADEPMTTFAQCMQCRSKWSYSG